MGSTTDFAFFLKYFTLVIVFALSIAVQETYATSESEAPFTKLGQHFSAPTLKFFYCYSCGYRKLFDEYVTIIGQRYPDMVVDGRNYDPPGLNMFLSRLIGVSKLLVILCIFSHFNFFQYLGQMQQPGWWTWCVENKLYSCMMLFFLCNIVEVQLMSSGAFEISLNDVPVWSKLETGRIPQPNELFQIIESQMKFSESKIDVNPGFAK